MKILVLKCWKYFMAFFRHGTLKNENFVKKLRVEYVYIYIYSLWTVCPCIFYRSIFPRDEFESASTEKLY